MDDKSLSKIAKSIAKVQTYYFIKDKQRRPYGYVDRLGTFTTDFNRAFLTQSRRTIEEFRSGYINTCYWFKGSLSHDQIFKKVKVLKIELTLNDFLKHQEK